MCCTDFCRKHFPEWTRETSIALFLVKLLVIIIIAAVVSAIDFFENEIFSDATITYESMAVIVMYGIVLGYLIVLYWPYQRRIAPMWLQLIIYVIWAVFTSIFFLNGWHFGWWHRSDIQTDALDLWTIGHTLSGLVLGFTLPWWWTFAMLTMWEVVERWLTVGLGDGESWGNQIVDIAVAVVGWWIIILVFPRSRKDIPWISSRNSCGNQGNCCFEVGSKNHVTQDSRDAERTNAYETVHV